MAVNEGTNDDADEDVLDRARRLLRDERPEDWTEVSGRIRERLASMVLPAQLFAAHVTLGERGSSLSVSSRVLVPTLRARLDTDDRVTHAVDLVAAPLARGAGRRRLGAVRVDLVCRYGADLRREGGEVYLVVAQVLREVLGSDPDFEPDRDVRVQVVDVVSGDPRDG